MTSSQLGVRRICEACTRPFYDLNRTPGVCPKCGTVFVSVPVKQSTRGRRPKLAAVPAPNPEIEADTAAGADVPLLEVDDEEDAEKAEASE